MNAATEFDVGPLTWVKSEIDLALERAIGALQQFTNGAASGAPDLTQIKFCRTHLHQVQGALTIVGLDGVTQFAEAVEVLLDDLEQQKYAADATAIALAQKALAAIGHYLDDLVSGQSNQPLRLLPLYREIQTARGLERVSATDLFFPDLSVRPPRREAPARKLSPAAFQTLLRQERARFQRGLLSWLRAPEDRKGVREMLDAIRHIEDTQDAASARAFWWVATGFLSALADGFLPEDAQSVKQLCARIDLQIRRLLEGSRNVAERLMRDALYFVASAESTHAAVQKVKDTYQLQSAIPMSDVAAPAPKEALRRKLGELIASAEESWGKYCTGSVQSLSSFKGYANALANAALELESTDFSRLTQAVAAAANWLAEEGSRHSDALSMEIATAILLVQSAQQNFQSLGKDFAHQVDVTVARIHACLAGAPPAPGSEVPLLDEMSRKAQEKMLIGQVAKEIQNNFAQIEQVLDGFFRDPAKRGELVGLEVPFRQVSGALTMMRHDAAAEAVRKCSGEIKRFAEADYAAVESDFEGVANQLSLIGFFIDSLQHGAVDFESFARQIQSPAAPDVEENEAELAEISVEEEVEQHKRATHAMLEALKEQPDDAQLREGLRSNLITLKNDADLVADKQLGEQTKAMLSALDAGASDPARLEQAMESFKPQSLETAKPSAETVQLAQANSDEVDAELLGIFLEEAHEVLASIDENLNFLREQPHNVEYLTTIRRSFHTLKGSGRMVGLKDVGETAWSIEQTLNLWLRQETEVAEPLFNLLGEAYTLFSSWVAQLEAQSGELPDPTALVALSEQLRRGKEEGELPLPFLQDSVEKVQEASIGDAVELVDDGLPFSLEAEPETPAVAIPAIALESSPVGDDAATNAFVGEPEQIEISDFDFESPPEVIEAAPLEPIDDTPVLSSEAVLPESRDESAGEDAPVLAPDYAAEHLAQQKITVSPLLFEIFTEEATAHLETLRRELPILERDELSPTPHEMYRAAHTLAGISATVGLTSINRLGLALEHALLRRDNSAHPGSFEALGVIRQAVGELDLVLSGLAAKREPTISHGLVEALESLYPTLASLYGDAESNASGVGDAEASAPSQGEVLTRAFDLSPLATHDEPSAFAADESSPPPLGAEAPQALDVQQELATRAERRIAGPQLQDEIDEQLLPIFLEEAIDLNHGIATQLRAWRSAPANMEPVRTLTRQLHTLKGSARMAGAMNLGEIAHGIETRVELASSAGEVSVDVIDEIDSAYDVVLHIIERLQRGEFGWDSSLSAEHPAALDQAVQSDADAIAPELKSAMVASIADRRHAPAERQDGEAERETGALAPTLRVRADLIDRLVNEAGELSISRARIEGEMRSLKESLLDLTENVIRLRRQLREIEIQAESQMQSRTAHTDEQHVGFDPLEFDRFTRFQELTRMMAESVNDVATVQQNLLKNLDDANAAIIAQARLNREVQQELMAVRMVPFGSLADRLYRIVRQTSKELNKRANLDLGGVQVELDRSVLDKIVAPLEHMLRNAIAHGLEDRDSRRAQGKSDIGEITLGVKQEGNEIILSLADDGAGLDFERIRVRAIEAGLLDADEVAEEAQLADLIFTPGFSTASELSQVAGRGVGMDVVRTEVASLGGRVEVVSKPGQGTEFHLYIPLTLAVTKALLVRAGTRNYAIPSVMIEQVLDLKEAALGRIRDAGTAEWLGHHYPFSYLPHLLGDTQALPEQHRQYWTLLLRSGTRRISVQVDELLGNHEIVVKNIGPQLARVIGVDGATVLGNGDVVLILNPVSLSSRAQTVEYVSPVPVAPVELDVEASAAKLPTVMVVDDSLTVRKITGRLLAREGYQVILAKDGVEALEHLLDVIPDVMLVDIEMPRMDGFDLTRNIRADAHLKDIPIIMITSRTADKHRSYAFEIGVNHYLGKPYQEDELLQLVGEYVIRQRTS